MKKTNKKGFTIVELVIVIAVIAILAAVLIPTFSGVIESARESAALSEAKNAYTIAMTEVLKDGKIVENEAVYLDAGLNVTTSGSESKVWTITFTADNSEPSIAKTGSAYSFSWTNGAITVSNP